jgi:hypothetical protein
MARFVSGKHDIFAAVEVDFGVAPGAASFSQLGTVVNESIDHSGERAMIDPDYSRADYMHDPKDVGRDTCSVTIALPLRGNPETPVATESSELFADLAVLAAAVGIDTTQVAKDITSGNTTSFTYAGGNPAVGSVYGVLPISTSTVPQFRMLTAASGGSATLHKAVSPACNDGLAVAGVTIYPTADADSLSMQFSSIASGGAQATSLYSGLMGNLKISGEVGDDASSYLTATLEMSGDNFTQSNAATIATPTAAGITAPESGPIQFRCTSATIDGEEIPHAMIEFDAGLEWSEDLDATNCDGRNKWVLTARNPILNITIPRDSALTFDPLEYGPDETHDIIITAGEWPATFCLIVPKAELTESPVEGDSNGIRTYELQFRPLRPASAIYEWAAGLFGKTA